ncbi:small multidrug resistance family (SMR) protein [hydrothermal vent metagenome]|uniref:Small multidrug resistance family (SMR) protein n=1 Tax=hydrothermal vent metagenome TaxID=652676 RepID=A0A3B0RDE1_9ZZZZ
MAWGILIIAGLLETVWALAMKASNGFTHPVWTVVTVVAAGVSFWLLGYALKFLPVGSAYAVWTGIGAVGVAIAGVMVFKEPATFLRFASIGLIVLGIAGLKISTVGQP